MPCQNKHVFFKSFKNCQHLVELDLLNLIFTGELFQPLHAGHEPRAPCQNGLKHICICKSKIYKYTSVAVTSMTYRIQFKIIGTMIPSSLDQFVKDKNK